MALFTEVCRVAGSKRQKCGFGGISISECERKGCCFDSSIRDVPWCFYGKGLSHLFHYSTISRDALIWSESKCYPLSVHNLYTAIYVGCQHSPETL